MRDPEARRLYDASLRADEAAAARVRARAAPVDLGEVPAPLLPRWHARALLSAPCASRWITPRGATGKAFGATPAGAAPPLS